MNPCEIVEVEDDIIINNKLKLAVEKPLGDYLVTKQQSTVRLWDIYSGECTHTIAKRTEIYDATSEGFERLPEKNVAEELYVNSVKVWNQSILDEILLQLFLEKALLLPSGDTRGWLGQCVIYSAETEKLYKSYVKFLEEKKYLLEYSEFSPRSSSLNYEWKCIEMKRVHDSLISETFDKFSKNGRMNMIQFKKALCALDLNDQGLERFFVDNFQCKASVAEFAQCIHQSFNVCE